MAGDCTYRTHYAIDDTFGTSAKRSDDQLPGRDGCLNCVSPAKGFVTTATSSPYFEFIGGLLYRKKLEKGFVHYREVLAEDKRLHAIATFHGKRPGMGHHTLEETYRLAAEHYWWEGMFVQVRDFVLGCEECQLRKTERKELSAEGCVSRTVTSHSQEVLSRLDGQRGAGLFCDITLKMGSGRSFSAHRAVLAAVSEYFQEVFTEMTSDPQSHIDLTGFSEESLLPLLEFSYTSTLTLNVERLAEVSTLARHLRMWPALDACAAIQREQDSAGEGCPKTTFHAGPRLSPVPGDPSLEVQRDVPDSLLLGWAEEWQWKRKQELGGRREEDELGEGSGSVQSRECFRLSLEESGGSGGECSPRAVRSQCQTRSWSARQQQPCSPARRMKLLDFKSPSSKRKPSPRPPPSSIPPSPSSSTRRSSSIPPSPSSIPSSPRLLRSSPGAALALRRLLPDSSTFKGKRRPSSSSSRAPRPKPGLPEFRRVRQPEPMTPAVPSVTSESPVEVEQQQQQEEAVEEEVQSGRAQEKYRLLSVLGLQRKSLLPGPEALTGWRQKKRLRKLKVSSYSLTARRKPRAEQGLPGALVSNLAALAGVNSGVNASLSLSLCDMTRVEMLRRGIRLEPQEPISTEQVREGRRRCVRPLQPAPPSARNTRSKVCSLPRDAPQSLSPSRRGRGAPLSLPPSRRGRDAPQSLPPSRRGRDAPLSLPPSRRGRGAPQSLAPSRRGRDAPLSLPPSRRGRGAPLSLPPSRRGRDAPQSLPPSRRGRGAPLSLPPSRRGRDAPQSLPPSRRAQGAPQSRSRTTERGAPKRSVVRSKGEPASYAIPLCAPMHCNANNPHPPPAASRDVSRGNSPSHQQSRRATAESGRMLRYNSGRPAARTKSRVRAEGRGEGSQPGEEEPNRNRAVKEEPADPLPLCQPFPTHKASELGKRQSKPPVKLLDPGFLFGFCRPAAGGGVKKEEDRVDICLTRSVSRGCGVSPGNDAVSPGNDAVSPGNSAKGARLRAKLKHSGLDGPRWAGQGGRTTPLSSSRRKPSSSPPSSSSSQRKPSRAPSSSSSQRKPSRVGVKQETRERSVTSQRSGVNKARTITQAPSNRSSKVKREPPKVSSDVHVWPNSKPSPSLFPSALLHSSSNI